MIPFSYLNLEIDASGIAILTLNRPDMHNAFDDVMVQELISALEQLNQLDAVRVILLKAQGKSFSAGADLAWMQRMASYDKAENLADAALLAKLMHMLYATEKTTIALVQGAAYGGGVGLVACCDVVLASHEALFCFSEVKLGLTPAVISPYVIRAIGERQARRYFLTAESIDAVKAVAIGLVHEVLDKADLLNKGYQLAQQILQNGSEAVKSAKQLIQMVSKHSLDDHLIQKTVENIASIRRSEDAQERLQAFLKKSASKE